MDEAGELTLTIARHLEVDHQYVEFVEVWDTGRIRQVRSAGRKAGRLLGWKIMTHATEPNDEGRVTVVVAVREWPDPEERARLEERAILLMNRYMADLRARPDSEE